MRTIGFIGCYDKTDLIIYIAKILVAMGKRTIVIDATTNQKANRWNPVSGRRHLRPRAGAQSV